MFYSNRVERYEFELLNLRAGAYTSAGLLDNVRNASISVDFSREVVSTANFTLNETGEIDYLTDRIRPWYCLGEHKWPLGVYMLITPTKLTDGRAVTRTVYAYDPLLAISDDKVDAAFTLPEGSPVVESVRSIIDSVGDWVRHNIEDNDSALREPMTWEIATPKLEIVNRLLATINYYPLWADGQGCFRAIPWRDKPLITWEFADNDKGLYLPVVNANIDYSEVYNKVIIVADQLEGEEPPLISVRTLEDIGLGAHPFSKTNLGRYKVLKLDSESVSQDYIDNRARKVLLKGIESTENVNYEHAFISSRSEEGQEDGLPWQGDSFKFKNKVLDLEAIFSVEEQSLTLQPGELVRSAIRRVVNV